jgi:hypothetical protein
LSLVIFHLGDRLRTFRLCFCFCFWELRGGLSYDKRVGSWIAPPFYNEFSTLALGFARLFERRVERPLIVLLFASRLGFKSLRKADYPRSSIRFMHGPQKRKSVISCVLPTTVIDNGRESWEGLNSAVFREAALLIPPRHGSKPSTLLPRRVYLLVHFYSRFNSRSYVFLYISLLSYQVAI